MPNKLPILGLCLGLLAVVSVPLAPTAHAQNSEKGVQSYQQDDYATTLAEWRSLAKQGDAEAQFNLGIAYDLGEGVEQNHTTAAEWYRRAAEQGDVDAQFNLGVAYEFGEGVVQDHTEAARWYRKAAEQGDAEAQYFLGNIYRQGRGFLQDYQKAHVWYNIASANGDKEAEEARDIVENFLSPDALVLAQSLARRCVESIERGDEEKDCPDSRLG